MENQTVLYEQSGNIVTITYNRPDNQNAINGQMRKELNDAGISSAKMRLRGWRFLQAAALLSVEELTYVTLWKHGDFKGTFWEKPTINSFESGKKFTNRSLLQ